MRVGTIAGLLILLVQLFKEKQKEQKDKKEILKILSPRIEQFENNHIGPDDRGYGVSTIELAYFSSLPTDRVQYICKKYKEFVPIKKGIFRIKLLWWKDRVYKSCDIIYSVLRDCSHYCGWI